MNWHKFIVALITLHTAAGVVVEVNPDLITHLRNPTPGNALFTDKVNCLINMADGRFVAVVETCESIRRAIENRP